MVTVVLEGQWLMSLLKKCQKTTRNGPTKKFKQILILLMLKTDCKESDLSFEYNFYGFRKKPINYQSNALYKHYYHFVQIILTIKLSKSIFFDLQCSEFASFLTSLYKMIFLTNCLLLAILQQFELQILKYDIIFIQV